MTTFVLIHGAGSEAWYWHLVEPELRAAGHDVVAPDLPCDDDAAGFTEYADVVVDAIGTRFAVTAKRPDGGTFTVRGTLFGGNCFSSGSGLDVYFGLSNADRILSLEIDWPDGTVETRTAGLAIDSRLVVERGHMTGELSRRMGHVSTGTPAQVAALLSAAPVPPPSAVPPLAPRRGILFSCG